MNIKQVIKEVFSNIKKDWYLPVTEYQVYSEQEQVVGVWTDGKPLYRKTFSGTAGARSAWVKIVDLGTNCTIVRGEAHIVSSDGLIIPAGYSTGAMLDALYNRDASGIKLGAASISHNLADWVGLPVRMTVEYTKTTDTTTTTKVPFEPLTEYSTEEKMIGYWIDGKPLYRKTLTNVPLGTVVATDVDTLVNVNNVCSYNGSLFSWGGGNALNSGLNLEKSGSQYTLVANSPTSYVYGDVGIFTIEYTKTTD